MTPSQPKYTKSPPQIDAGFYFLMEKPPKNSIFKIKPVTKYNYKTFREE
jgi:hypothetical protein